jgi:hypothetical protein
MTNAPELAAGWHQDPSNPAQWRWWDGAKWTNDVAPMQSQQQAASMTPTPHLVGGGPSTQVVTASPATGDDWRHSHYIIAQRGFVMDRTYFVHLPDGPGGSADKPGDGHQVATVKRKMISIKEKIKFRDAADNELFGIQSSKVLNFGERYIVSDASGAPIAQLKKQVMRSFLRTTWCIYDPSGEREIAVAQESSMLFAIARRLSDWAAFFPYQFTIAAGSASPGAGSPLGTFRRRWGLRDRYDLDMTADQQFLVDRRAAVALGLALDALQRR